MTEPDVRKGMPPVEIAREEFERRYRSQFADPAFVSLQHELDAIVSAAWDAYSHSRKSPVTRKAGAGFADPDYELSVDWLAARTAILEAQRHDDARENPRILIINGSARSEHTCPGEMSKIPARCRKPGVWSSSPSLSSLGWALPSTSSISRGSPPSSARTSTPANPAFPPPCRSVTAVQLLSELLTRPDQ